METVVVHRPQISLLMGTQALLQLLDLATTFFALQAGAYEANPVSRALIEGPGWWAYGAIKIVLAAVFIAMVPVMARMSHGERRLVVTAMTLFATLMVMVVINNAIILF